MTARLGDCVNEAGEESEQKGPQVGEDLADVVPAAAEHGKDGIAKGALEGAAGETAIGLMWPISGSMALRRRRSLARRA